MSEQNETQAPTHMAIDSITFSAMLKIVGGQPWDQVNNVMTGLMQARPVNLKPTPKKPDESST